MMDYDLEDLDLYGIIRIRQSIIEEETKTAHRKKDHLQCHPDENSDKHKAAQLLSLLHKLLTILADMGTRLDNLMSLNSEKSCEKERDSKRKKQDKLEKKELKNLRIEYLALLATVKFRINVLLGQHETETKKIGSFKLKVKWVENGVYYKDNLTSLFSKYGYVSNVLVLENKSVALVEFIFKTSAITAKKWEVGYPICPLTVSFLGDYGQGAKHSSNHTSNQNLSTSASAYQNPKDKSS